GDVYLVFGIAIWRGVFHYLLTLAPGDSPSWYPALLFRVVDGRLPSGWSFRLRDTPTSFVDALWGYPELVEAGGRHYDDLLEREPDALEIFGHRRAEIEADPVNIPGF